MPCGLTDSAGTCTAAADRTAWGVGGRWWVLHSRPRQEKVVARDLSALNVRYFLPLINQVRYYGRRKVYVDLPLFPGYLFLHGSVEEAWTLDRAGRLSQIIEVHDQARIELELQQIRRVLEEGNQLDPHPYLTVGMRVEVRSGPLKGVQGVIERKQRRSRLVLQIEVLGQAASLEIDGSLLDPVERAVIV
jgi:transcription termination/antitermination protein NusG